MLPFVQGVPANSSGAANQPLTLQIRCPGPASRGPLVHRHWGLRSKHSRALVLTGGQVVDPKSLSSCLHDAPYRGLERSTGFPPTHGGLRHHSQTRGARGANAQHNPSWLEDLPDAAVVDLRKGFSPRRTLAVAFQHYAARTNRDKPNEHNWVHLDLRRSCAQSSLWSAPLMARGTVPSDQGFASRRSSASVRQYCLTRFSDFGHPPALGRD